MEQEQEPRPAEDVHEVTPETVAEKHQEMDQKGAEVKGEGEVTPIHTDN